MFVHPDEIDERLYWPLGRAERLARRKRLPRIVLPDGSIRFIWAEIEALLVRVSANGAAEGEPVHAA